VDDDDICSRRVGTVLRDKWKLERLVGIGGMAAVYVARHKIGRLDAIKILHPEYARADQVRARFEQEAHVLNRFRHPGAVEVRDLETTEDGAPFIVMELLEGQSLAERIRESPMTVDEALRVADEVLDVLAAAHAQGIIHRDIKPDNLFVTPGGAIKVLDFGVAQLRSGARDLKTKTGTTLGTVAYMPPEQLKGIDIDARADIYGVGATMFRMISKQTPHTADSDVELMMKVLSDPAPRLATVAPGVRADVAKIVDRALAFDRDARYADARAMQTDVRAARAAPSAEVAAAVQAPSDAKTVTPQRPLAGGPVLLPTMAAAPDSSLLREAAPESRLATRAVSVPLPAEAMRTSISGGGAAESPREQRTVAGLPLLVWLVAGAVVLLALGALGASVAIAAARSHEPDAGTVSPVATTPPTFTAAPAPIESQWDEPREEPRDEPPPPGHHHHPPHGHGKHRP
jgi:serine/threonine protein kinase